MSETIFYEQKQPTVNEQVERFTAIFMDLRKVMGVGFKHAHQHGLSTTQFIVLGLIGKAQACGETCTISSIAGDLDIDPATVVRTVDSLEKRGLVERRRSREDRRQVFVEFTDAGRAARASHAVVLRIAPDRMARASGIALAAAQARWSAMT